MSNANGEEGSDILRPAKRDKLAGPGLQDLYLQVFCGIHIVD